MKTLLTLTAIVCVAPFLILAWMWLDERLADRRKPARQPRLSSEWSRLTALQDKARAEIDAEAGHFQLWEQEVSA